MHTLDGDAGTTGTLGDSARVRATEKCVTRTIAGETLIIPIAAGVADLESIYTLNDVASRIWALLAVPTTMPAIVDAVVSEFAVSPDQARADVREFLETLRSARLLADAPGA